MPDPKDHARGQRGLPVFLCGYDPVHQLEKPIRVVLDLDVDLDMRVR